MESYVVVFPTVFSKNKMPQLVSNIKQILKVRDQSFRTVKRDGDVILVDANDPVFASSAIGLVSGIRKIAIARRVENNFEKIVSEISTVGGNLLLSGERFLVKVEGTSSGFVSKDAELAATSAIIEKKSELGAKPGTEHNHDKLLYTYMTKKNAYVCIFTDDGVGGIPFKSEKNDAICAIYDELSAVSCYETMRQGYNPKVIILYRKKSELINIAKMINQILPRILKKSISVEVFHTSANTAGRNGYGLLTDIVSEVLISRAKECNISHISVPVSPMMFSVEFVDHTMTKIFGGGKIPVLPLVGLDYKVFDDMVELGMKRHIKKMTRRLMQEYGSRDGARKELKPVLESKQEITITVGPNNIHDFLDALDGNN